VLQKASLPIADAARCLDISKEFRSTNQICAGGVYGNKLLHLFVVKPGVDPTKLFFLRFFFFGVKLGHFTINIFFLYVTKMQAYQRKMEKFFVSEENKFGRIKA